MSETCEKMIARILESEQELPVEVTEHLSGCRECRKLAADWAAVRQAVGRVDVPATLDQAVKDAAHEHYRQFRMVRRTVIKTIYLAAAAACAMLLFGAFFFSDYRPEERRFVPAAPGSAWYSGLDRRLFELDTELELNREMLNLAPDNRSQEIMDIILPPPPPGYAVELDDGGLS